MSAGGPRATAAGAVLVSGVVLAAGRSERFGDEAKQLLALDGETLVHRAVRQALASRLAEVLVVVGHRGREVAGAVADLPARVVENPAFAAGQSGSVKAGLAAVSERARAALFLPCDQPFLGAREIDLLLDAYAATCGPVVLPVHGDRRGSPVLFDRALFAELAAIEGDQGGRQLLASRPEAVVAVPFDSELPLLDVDRPGDLDRLAALAGRCG